MAGFGTDKMRVRSGLGISLSVFALLLASCTPSLEVVPAHNAPVAAVSTVTPQQHDLALVAVDFDPPLDFAQIRNNGGVTLVVAVENRGQSAEADVRINAYLQDLDDQLRELSREAVLLGQLNPGALRVVRFAQVSDLPLRERYRLVVSVEAVAGETDIANNSRNYDIVIHNGR
jgi:hypothetical protein